MPRLRASVSSAVGGRALRGDAGPRSCDYSPTNRFRFKGVVSTGDRLSISSKVPSI
jgi:hypothetical protein